MWSSITIIREIRGCDNKLKQQIKRIKQIYFRVIRGCQDVFRAIRG